MRKLISLIIGIGVCIGSAFIWGEEHPAILCIGCALACAGLLTLVLMAFEKIGKVFNKLVNNILYLIIGMVLVSILAGYKIMPPLMTCIVTAVLSTLLVLTCIRQLAQKALRSIFWGDVFSKVTGYKLKYIIFRKKEQEELREREEVIEDKSVIENVIGALQGLGYSKKESKQAAEYALSKKQDGTLPELVTCALTYFASEDLLEQIEDE